MRLLRAFGIALATAVVAIVVTKYADVPVKAIGGTSARFEHYFDVVENDGNSAISFFFWALFLVPVCSAALFVWTVSSLDRPRSLLIDLAFLAALVLVPQILFYGDWGAEGWYILPVAALQSAFGIVAMTAVFRLLVAWRPAILREN